MDFPIRECHSDAPLFRRALLLCARVEEGRKIFGGNGCMWRWRPLKV